MELTHLGVCFLLLRNSTLGTGTLSPRGTTYLSYLVMGSSSPSVRFPSLPHGWLVRPAWRAHRQPPCISSYLPEPTATAWNPVQAAWLLMLHGEELPLTLAPTPAPNPHSGHLGTWEPPTTSVPIRTSGCMPEARHSCLLPPLSHLDPKLPSQIPWAAHKTPSVSMLILS